MLARLKLEIRTDRIGFDPAIAFNDDGVGASAARGRWRCMRHAGIKANAPHPEEQAGNDQPPFYPPTHPHSQRAFIPLMATPDDRRLSLSPPNRTMALILLVFSSNPHARTLYPLLSPT
jgi:hypothetical protein